MRSIHSIYVPCSLTSRAINKITVQIVLPSSKVGMLAFESKDQTRMYSLGMTLLLSSFYDSIVSSASASGANGSPTANRGGSIVYSY